MLVAIIPSQFFDLLLCDSPSLALAANDPALAAFVDECRATGTAAAEIETAEKKGFDTGLSAVHPLDPAWRLPVFVANFVLMDYGTGAVFGVPAHDQRDLDFARKYMLPVTRVVAASEAEKDRNKRKMLTRSAKAMIARRMGAMVEVLAGEYLDPMPFMFP